MTSTAPSTAVRRSRSRRTGSRWAAGAAVSGLLAGAVLAPPAEATPSTPRPRVVQQELDQLVSDDTFPGALAAVRDDRGRTRSYTAGVGDLATGAAVPVNGRVRIASNTKTFTAVVVLQLVAEGRVDLDAPIETYLPGRVRGDGIDGRTISVRQLLQHTSGLPDYVTPEFVDPANRFRVWQPGELLALALAQPALFTPGTSWRYSNTNYLLAGLLVEEVTGRPVGQQITSRLIRPLQLRGTYWPTAGEVALRGRHPRGYSPGQPGEPLVDVTEQDPSGPGAAGALVSTPADLLRFFTALLRGRLLPPELLRQMQTTVTVPEADYRGATEGYGLGLQTFTLTCGGTAWTHGGNIDGYTTRQAVTAGGRSVVLAVTGTVATLEAGRQVEDTIDDLMCRQP